MLIYLCSSNAPDEVCAQVMTQLLVENTSNVKLEKIIDKQNEDASLMHLCAQRNKVSCMDFLFTHGVKVDVLNRLHASPLIFAAAQNMIDAAFFLISKGANINLRDEYSRTPLLVALRNKNYEMVEFLAEQRQLDPDLIGTGGNTPLHMITRDGDLQGVMKLVENCKALVQRRNNNEENVLFCALSYPHIVEYLCTMNKGQKLYKLAANSNVDGRNVVHVCAVNGLLDSLIIILKNLDYNTLTEEQLNNLFNTGDNDGDTPLLLAITNIQLSFVQFLCMVSEIRLNKPDQYQHTPLYYAVNVVKSEEMTKILVAAGADLKPEGKSEEYVQSSVINCCFSLNTFLSTLLVSTTLGFILVVFAIAIGFFASSIKSTTLLIRQTEFADLESFLKNSLRTIEVAEQVAHSEVAYSYSFLENETVVKIYSWNMMMASYDSSALMTGVYCSTSTGKFAGFFRSPQDSSNVYFYSTFNGNNTTQLGPVSFTLGEYIPPPIVGSPIVTNVTTQDLMQQPPYHSAQQSPLPNPIWTSSNTGNRVFRDKQYMSYTRPLRYGQRDFFCYCAVDIQQLALSTALQGRGSHPGSITIVIDANMGNLVATNNPLLVQLYNGNSTSVDSNIRADFNRMMVALNASTSHYGGMTFTKLPSTTVYDEMEINGQKNTITIGAATDFTYMLNLVIIQVIPLIDFERPFYISIGVLIAVILVVIVVGIAIAFLSSWLFMRPIKSLTHLAENIRTLKLEKVEKALGNKSNLSESRLLQQSYISMNERLKQLRTFIPDHILTVLDAETGEFGHSLDIVEDMSEQEQDLANKDSLTANSTNHGEAAL